MRKTKMEKGITLIALLLTIVVLVILASVAINSIQNDKVVNKTKNAASEYEIMEEKTKLQKEILEWQLVDAGDIQTLKKYLEEIYGKNNVQPNTDESLTVTVPSGNKYIATEDGDVTYTDGTTSNGGSSSGSTTPTTGAWTQNGTSVTKGSVTLSVGQTVTGYDAGVSSYTGGWAVLGAENGKLLLVSKENVQNNIALGGKEGGTVNGTECVAGYNNGISYLNTLCSTYLNSTLADEARSIKVEDINRVTGYNPENTGDGTRYGAGYPYQYGNKATYALNTEGKVVYTSDTATGSNAGGTSTYTSFEHVDGRTLTTSNSIDVTSNSYYYYPNTLTTSSSGTTNGIETNSDVYKVLFKKANGTDNDSYWLASQFQAAGAGIVGFGLHDVISGRVHYSYLWFSGEGAYSGSYGARVVVVLKSGVNITSAGVIS